MNIADLSDFTPGAYLTADVVIVGGGPAGYAVAAGLKDLPIKILILESGLNERSEAHEVLNTVESVGEPAGAARIAWRKAFHTGGMPEWSAEQQGFGVRRRGLGGLSEVWSGKSAVFDDLDFDVRPWVARSGWPFPKSHLQPYIDRAAEMLNLGPSHHNDQFWDAVGMPAPEPPLNPQILRSFFWQFARARHDRLDFVRFKQAFAAIDAGNVQIVLNATVKCLYPACSGNIVREAEATTLGGTSYRIRARTFVLATGAIETPRLLLNSGRLTGYPFGNAHDLVGRFLMDHPSATIGRFRLEDCGAINRRFGFYRISESGQMHMYQHGLALSPDVQRREGLLNCAAYMMEQRAPDDPWEAIKRLLRRQSGHVGNDALAVFLGAGLVLRGVSSRVAASGARRSRATQRLIDLMIRRAPNTVVRRFPDRGLPHKLTGIEIAAITEQQPDPKSRVVLGDRLDPLGVPIPLIAWKIDEQATHSLMRIGQLIEQEFPRAGLPKPILEPWVVDERPMDGRIIDMAHTAGTTRLAERPELGVVDLDGRVFGLANLYVAGASVFPTVGHANPTLMILAVAMRLADHLENRLREPLQQSSPAQHARGSSCA